MAVRAIPLHQKGQAQELLTWHTSETSYLVQYYRQQHEKLEESIDIAVMSSQLYLPYINQNFHFSVVTRIFCPKCTQIRGHDVTKTAEQRWLLHGYTSWDIIG